MASLQRHVEFFDTNLDGKLTISELFQGLRRLRISLPASGVGSIFLPLLLGPKTGGSLFHINVKGINQGLHPPDDAGSFENEFPLTQELYTLEDIKTIIRKRGGKIRRATFLIEYPLLFTVLRKFRRLRTPEGTDAISRTEIQQLIDGSLFYRLVGEPVPT